MHRTAAFVTAALLAVAAAVPTAAVPAAASPAPERADKPTSPAPERLDKPTSPAPERLDKPTPPRGLFLTVSGAENTWIRGVLLHCSPEPAGPHPDAVGACAALDEARGVLDDLQGEPHPCTKQYSPVTVSATGAWRGRPTAWHKTFPNACELATATGAVFRF